MKNLTKLSPAQKRVAIAKDVLAQIEQKMFLIKQGKYWDIVVKDGYQSCIGRPELLESVKVCKVCAAGAAVISSIRLFNKREVYVYNGCTESDIIDDEFFDNTQMALIESCFEPNIRAHLLDRYLSDEEKIIARKFRHKFKGTVEFRAIAIFKNIVKHKGTFRPELS